MNIQKLLQALGLLVLGFIFGYSFYVFAPISARGIGNNTVNSLLESSKIQEAYSYLERYFYGFDSKTQTEKEDAMIDALAKSLGDKHTSYFNPKDAKEFSESLAGDFEGIGAVIKEHPKGIQIMKVLKDSPAMKSHLQKGDVITKVNETNVVGMTAEAAVEIIRGPKGSTVSLSILSGSTEKSIQIIRDQVMVPSVYSEVLSGSTIGYIEVGFFGEHTGEEFQSALQSLTNSGITGLIIDGRNNGGGFLDASVEVVSALLPKDKTVVVTRGVNAQQNTEYTTVSSRVNETTIPVIMLVNNMSASATEIMAGALQDYNRALLIGEKTYGKGSVQEPFILSDQSMLKITVAKWFTPSDRMIDKAGIEPDVSIGLTDDDYKNGNDRQLEAAKILIQDLITTKTSFTEYKKDTDSIKARLQEAKILP